MIGYLALTAPWRFARRENDVGEFDAPQSPYRLHGFPHPTVFKTLRNAITAAGPCGQVLVLDLGVLPLVRLEEIDPGAESGAVARAAAEMRDRASKLDLLVDDPFGQFPDDIPRSKLDEQYTLAERQMMIWAERVQKLKNRMKAMSTC